MKIEDIRQGCGSVLGHGEYCSYMHLCGHCTELERLTARVAELEGEIRDYEGPKCAELLAENTQFTYEIERLRAATQRFLALPWTDEFNRKYLNNEEREVIKQAEEALK